MQFLFQPLNHLRPIRAWAASRGGEVEFDVATFVLSISVGSRSCRLIPRFSIRTANGLAYTNVFGEQGAFVGWLPYDVRRWPAATDKVIFKQWCSEQGLRTPEWGFEPLGPNVDYLVKGRRGSFGKGISGPFAAGAAEPHGGLPSDCIYEAFKFGRAAKAWYWRDRPLAVEVIDPPHVLGDGHRSIEALLTQVRGSFDKSYSPENARPLLAWQGLLATDVPSTGRKVWVGYKYVTDYDATVFRDRDAWATLDASVRGQFLEAGREFQRAIPAAMSDSVYTIDAVIDGQGVAWFLEMNCHPMVHPKVYDAVLTDLLAPPH